MVVYKGGTNNDAGDDWIDVVDKKESITKNVDTIIRVYVLNIFILQFLVYVYKVKQQYHLLRWKV